MKKEPFHLLYQAGFKKYLSENRISFHMPGHKGRYLKKGISNNILPSDMFPFDITASYERENLYNPSTFLKDSLEQLTSIYKTKRSFYLVNGSTGGNQAALLSVLRPNDKILMPRNVHKLIYSTLVMTRAIPVYLEDVYYQNNPLLTGIDPQKLEKMLIAQPDIKVVYFVNPSYVGICSDIRRIIAICKFYGKIVIVDEAHGAHFFFHPELPCSAVEEKADIVIQSTHKTLNALSQTALLHICTDAVDEARVELAIGMSQTTSPNTIFLLNVEACVVQMANEGRILLDNTLKLVRYARNGILNIASLHCYGNDLLSYPSLFEFDETKLYVNVSQLNITGYELKAILGKKFKIEAELADHQNILFSISLGNTISDIKKLIKSLKKVICDNSIKIKSSFPAISISPPTLPIAKLSPADAFYAAQQDVPLQDSIGKICCEMITPYPPGIPLIMPGEIITKELVDYIRGLIQMNVSFTGSKYKDVSHIVVATEK